MTELFIAEKRDVGLSLAHAISGKFKANKQYAVGEDGRIYTWAMGHLVKLAEPESYNEAWAKWAWDSLPIIPPQVKTEPIDDPYRKAQLNTIRNLVFSDKTSKIIVCTDAAIEGQLIYELIKMELKFNKPEYRLWTASLQPAAIVKAYKNMKPNSEYKNLKRAGLSRTLSDYIIGLTATRALTLSVQDNFSKEGTTIAKAPTIQAGRIMTPVLAMVYKRAVERENFSKLKYYPMNVEFNQNGEIYKGSLQTEELITDKTIVDQIQNRIKNSIAAISDIKEEEKKQSPPGLLDLTEVSKIANSRWGYTGSEVLNALQELYLMKVVTYPRTDVKYISEEEIPFMHQTFELLKNSYPNLSKNSDKERVSIKSKRICRPEAITDHHAILPEAVIPKDLTPIQQNVYDVVLERFFLQFQGDYIYIQKKITTTVDNSFIFDSYYNKTIDTGWKSILEEEEDSTSDEKDEEVGAPKVGLGQVDITNIIIGEKETKPAAAYTDGSLMDAMRNISKSISNPELRAKIRENGIGTSATRADTIKKLIDIEYLMYNNKKIDITKKGRAVIELIQSSNIKLLTSAELTAMWEKELEAIQNGKSTEPFMKAIYAFAHQIVSEASKFKVSQESFYSFVGKCPLCSSGIIETAKKYVCASTPSNCNFFIWKQQYKKSITIKMLEQLLQKGETNLYTFTSNKGTKYKAKLSFDSDNNNGYLKMNF